MAHARLSASAAHRWMTCPGSVALSAPLPNKTSIHAATGTFAHEVASDHLLGLEAAPLRRGEKSVVDGFEVVCDQEMIDGVMFYVEAIEVDSKPGDKTFTEVDLTPALSKLDPDLGGTADRARWRPKAKQLRVTDFKYGAGKIVEVEDNKQLMIYALGALLAVNEPATEVVITVVQPRIDHEDGRLRDWTFPAAMLLDFAADVEKAATRTREPNAPLVPGEAQCQFCPARHVCPALEEKQHALTAYEFSTVVPHDPWALSAALDAIPLVEARIKALREFAYSEAERGNAPPGYKLVAKRPTRKWAAETSVIEWAKVRAIDPFETPTLKSPAQLEKGLKKAEKEDLARFVISVSSGHTLAPASDKRQAVHQALAGEFAVISTNEDN